MKRGGGRGQDFVQNNRRIRCVIELGSHWGFLSPQRSSTAHLGGHTKVPTSWARGGDKLEAAGSADGVIGTPPAHGHQASVSQAGPVGTMGPHGSSLPAWGPHEDSSRSQDRPESGLGWLLTDVVVQATLPSPQRVRPCP